MHKRSKLVTPQQINNATICLASFISLVLALSVLLITKELMHFGGIKLQTGAISGTLFILSAVFIIIGIVKWGVKHHLNEGLRYARLHSKTTRQINEALLDANFYLSRNYLWQDIAELPKITLSFTPDLRSGKLVVENSPKFDKKFEDIRFSSALGDFIVDYSYVQDNQNAYVFELIDSSVSKQLTFDSISDFKDCSKQRSDYQLFIDDDLVLPLHHYLLVGQTGSGKTYAAYGLILQALTKSVRYHLYLADPKGSSLATLGNSVSRKTTATKIEDIITLLTDFVNHLNARKAQMSELLKKKLDCDYRDFDLEPHVFIFDEFAAFETVIQTMPKSKRDEVASLLSQIVLQGRQLGFFIWIIMQQASSNQLPTYIRENIPFKVILGEAEKQTVVTTFGPGAEIPNQRLSIGEGFYTFPGVANTPRKCAFSKLDFDILAAANTFTERGFCKNPRSTPDRGD